MGEAGLGERKGKEIWNKKSHAVKAWDFLLEPGFVFVVENGKRHVEELYF